MQLRLSRIQKEASGLLSKSLIFCLDAKADFTPEEMNNIKKYKLGEQVIYNSEDAKKHLANSADATARRGLGLVTAGVHLALAKMSLNLTINKIAKGTRVECKDLDELLGAEEAIISACFRTREYLDKAATFDGKEQLIDFEQVERTGLHSPPLTPVS